jgi:outer membrane lipoprotein-sorting protein
MLGKLVCTTLLFTVSITSGTATAQSRVNLSASEIVNKNVAARGGLQAWRAVQSMSWKGKLGVGGNQRAPLPVSGAGKNGAKIPTDPRPKDEVQLPFRMEMERPRKVRFELQFKGQTAVQVYDGAAGWKLRPYLNRLEVEPFTSDESHIASMQSDLDGPLVDYAAKGTAIELVGTEKVEDHDTYKLKLTMKDGHSFHVWIDAKTFLEAKIEGTPRRLDGIEHPVEVYYRDYRQVNGLQIPFVLETKVLPAGKPASRAESTPVPVERIAIEGVEVNPKLDASLFTKPEIQTASNRH